MIDWPEHVIGLRTEEDSHSEFLRVAKEIVATLKLPDPPPARNDLRSIFEERGPVHWCPTPDEREAADKRLAQAKTYGAFTPEISPEVREIARRALDRD